MKQRFLKHSQINVFFRSQIIIFFPRGIISHKTLKVKSWPPRFFLLLLCLHSNSHHHWWHWKLSNSEELCLHKVSTYLYSWFGRDDDVLAAEDVPGDQLRWTSYSSQCWYGSGWNSGPRLMRSGWLAGTLSSARGAISYVVVLEALSSMEFSSLGRSFCTGSN